MGKKIIDLYHNDTITTYDEVCSATYFIILKGNQGMTMVDDKCAERIRAFEERRHPYWVYVFLDKGRELQQTKRLVELYKDTVGKSFVGYCIDIEEDNNQENCLEALNYLLSLNHKAMFYFQWGYVSRYPRLIAKRSDKCAFWECRYGDAAGNRRGTDRSDKYPFHSFADLAQYTEYGHCKGVEGYVDLNKVTGYGKSLDWFMTPYSGKEDMESESGEVYSGILPALPPRGYWMIGDGIEQYVDYKTQIRRLQRFLNWALDLKLKTDGIIGGKTRAAIIEFERLTGISQDGLFGKKCLEKAQIYHKRVLK